jgi:hypothetical protein
LNRSIVEPDFLSAATQKPLGSVGNASIGYEDFREVRLAWTALALLASTRGAL